MTDLFSNQPPPRPTRIGQANGEFLAHLAAMEPHQRAQVMPEQFPYACPTLVQTNAVFHGGAK